MARHMSQTVYGAVLLCIVIALDAMWSTIELVPFDFTTAIRSVVKAGKRDTIIYFDI